MKKEVTWGQLIGIIVTVIITFGGWIISVEVRLKSHEIQIQQIVELIKEQSSDIKDMSKKINDIHGVVIKHETILDQNNGIYQKSAYYFDENYVPSYEYFTLIQ
jgi:cell division protein FtsL